MNTIFFNRRSNILIKDVLLYLFAVFVMNNKVFPT
jgi:hypothetical protein